MKTGTGFLPFVMGLFLLLTTFTNHAQVKTVTIGKQGWMKENLNTSTFRNGDPISQVKTAVEWEKAFENGTPAWCYYDNDPENGKLYGKLYNGYAINDSRGLAPAGWHIPSDAEWTILTQYLGGLALAGPKLIIPGQYGGTNTSGFDGRLAGIRIPDGDFAGIGGGTMWGSSTIEKARMSWCVSVNVIGELDRDPINWGGGSSVRCIKDVQSITEKPKPMVKPKPAVVPDKPVKKEITGKLTDPRDGGGTYHTIKIGTQTWMTENLDVSTFLNGDNIMEAKTKAEWEKAGKEQRPAWCYYNYDSKNDDYGKLYNWFAVNDARGLAPAGWHIPAEREWRTLVTSLGGEDKALVKMRTATGWNLNTEGSNESGFAGLPGGCCVYNGDFGAIGNIGYWWSSSVAPNSVGAANFFAIVYNTGLKSWSLAYSSLDKSMGFSVRCVKN